MKTHDFPNIHFEKTSAEVHYKFDLDMSRFDSQFNKAQYELDSQIMTDMIKFMPKVTSTFIDRTIAESASIAGSGYVCAAAAPYGRFLYFGKTMVSAVTGSTWAKFREKKVLVSQFRGKTNASENLKFDDTANPDVTAEWYEEAKRKYKRDWVKLARRVAGNGR